MATYYRRSLAYHWRTNLATALGVAAGAAALTGALLVGDSMRGSLRDVAVRRLGRVDHVLVAPRFFREALAGRMAAADEFGREFEEACSIVALRGGVQHADAGTRAGGVQVFGVDARFWRLGGGLLPEDAGGLSGRSIILNEPLAGELNAKVGDDVLVRLGSSQRVPAETLLGNRDDTTLSLRLTVRAIVPASGMGGFAMTPTQYHPFNAFVERATLQRALKQPGRANAILVAGRSGGGGSGESQVERLQRVLDGQLALSDLGLKVRVDDEAGYAALESDSWLIEPFVEMAAFEAAKAVGATATPVLTYLANTIAVQQPKQGTKDKRAIPYSTVSAIDLPEAREVRFTLVDGNRAGALGPDEILLNSWAADDLQAKVGDRIELTYFGPASFGRLETEKATFTLGGIVGMEGLAIDRGLTPEYKGITDSPRLENWDPPFPVDLGRVREKDEVYWERYGPAPKAFVSLATGQKLWTRSADRFGRLTSIRLAAAKGKDVSATADAFGRELLGRLSPEQMGLSFVPLRARAIAASKGSTDFGMLFIGFSFFLILSAAMLVALLFRLGVERRSPEIGLLLAVGFGARVVLRLLLAEGACLAGIGAAAGLAGAVGYAWLMLAGLQSWWSAAVNAPFLQLHVGAVSMLIGLASSFIIALVSIAWALRGFRKLPVRSLLAGASSLSRWQLTVRQRRRPIVVALLALVMAGGLIVASMVGGVVPEAAAFFASGAAMLIACLAGVTAWMRRPGSAAALTPGAGAVTRLAVRNATRHPRRSLLTSGLIASATFVIVAVAANKKELGGDVYAADSGTGGYTLLAESAVGIVQDLNSPDGREALSLSQNSREVLSEATVTPFRLRPGDESSCLNLYQPGEPRILGATEAMIDAGRFRFASALSETDEEKRNPWTLLNKKLPDGAVPVIGDYSAVVWLLHLGLGKDLVISDERGREVTLRIMGLLSGSVLQGELVMAESRFADLFPSIGGYSFFLIEAPPAGMDRVKQALESDLSRFGFDVGSTAERLARYMAVENTYLSTFQTLGGLGVLLGTLGLAAVLLRNVWERRSELALLRALGYRRAALGWMVLAENAALLVVGLGAGAVSALVAVIPHVIAYPSTIPWVSLAWTLLAVLLTGLSAGVVALVPTLRSSLLPALRTE